MNRLEESAADSSRALEEAESKAAPLAASTEDVVKKPEPLQVNSWHLITAVFGKSGTKLYLDGALIQSSTYGGGLSTTTDSARYLVGACSLNPYNSFHGELKEVRLWRGVRTGEEIRDYSHKELSGSEPGLVGLWNFADRTKPAYDASPNRHHGRLVRAYTANADSGAALNEERVLSLGGNGNYLELPWNAFQGLVEATFECWAKWHSFSNSEHVFEFDAIKRVKVVNRTDSGEVELVAVTPASIPRADAATAGPASDEPAK